MLFTLAQARSELSRFVETGTCDPTVIDARINEALSRIMDMEDWESQRRLIRASVRHRCFALPRNVEKIMWADVDGAPVRVFGQPYQFLSSGPQDLDYTCAGTIYKHIVDQGDHWPTAYAIPDRYEASNAWVYYAGLPLYAFSTSSADTGKIVTVRGVNGKGEEIVQELPIQRWLLGEEGRMSGHFTGTMEPSDVTFKTIERVTKPATAGHITLYAIDVPNQYFYFLAKYKPADLIPQYRRYQLTNIQSDESRDTDNLTGLLALVRLRFEPMTDAADVCPIDSMQALKFMVMAIREENTGNLDMASGFEMKSRMVMEARQHASTMSSGTQIVFDVDHSLSLGRAMEYGGRIL